MQGALLGGFGTTQDITARKRATDALGESELRWRTLLENIPGAAYRCEIRPPWRVTVMSRGVGKVTGYPAEEFLGPEGRMWADLIVPEDLAKVQQAVEAGVSCRKSHEIEYRILHAGGGIRWVFERGKATYAPHGEPLWLDGVIVDSTGLKEAEKALRQRSLELQQLNATLDRRVQERTLALQRANEELQGLSARLLSAHEEERRKIAADVHDTLGSTLSAVKFKMEACLLEAAQQGLPAMTAPFGALIPMVKECIDECRKIQTDLRPPLLDDLGLLITLSWLCRRFQEIYTGISVEQDIGVEEADIADPLEIVLFRVAQEGLHNIAKHSSADRATLSLQKTADRLRLVLQDNGKGFAAGNAFMVKDRDAGLGLTSMQERVELSGGLFAIESAEGKGTIIRASWPLVTT